MSLLLDTHVILWLVADRRRVSDIVLDRISNVPERLLVSAVTAWEFEDLAVRGRLGPIGSFDQVRQALDLEVLDLPAHLWRIVRQLPDLHRDPIDRIVIAQAIEADMTLVTSDETMRRYPVTTLW